MTLYSRTRSLLLAFLAVTPLAVLSVLVLAAVPAYRHIVIVGWAGAGVLTAVAILLGRRRKGLTCPSCTAPVDTDYLARVEEKGWKLAVYLQCLKCDHTWLHTTTFNFNRLGRWLPGDF